MSLQTFVGTIEFQDLGAGQFILHTLDGKSSSYRLIIKMTSHEVYSMLKNASEHNQMITVQGELPAEGIMVTGSTHLPVILVQYVE